MIASTDRPLPRGRSSEVFDDLRPLRALGMAVAFTIVALLMATPLTAAPHVPTDDAVALERLPSPNDPRLHELRVLGDRLGDRPDDLHSTSRGGMSCSVWPWGPRYFGRAQGALLPWRENAEPPAGVRLVRAAVARAQHDFEGALADLGAVLAANPRPTKRTSQPAMPTDMRASRGCSLTLAALPAGSMHSQLHSPLNPLRRDTNLLTLPITTRAPPP